MTRDLVAAILKMPYPGTLMRNPDLDFGVYCYESNLQ